MSERAVYLLSCLVWSACLLASAAASVLATDIYGNPVVSRKFENFTPTAPGYFVIYRRKNRFIMICFLHFSKPKSVDSPAGLCVFAEKSDQGICMCVLGTVKFGKI